MEKIKQTEDKLVFSAKISATLANSIRRSIGAIPVTAVDELHIEKNDSALYDETVAHRIGLIPLKAPNNSKDSVFELSVSKTGPGYVYSSDIKGDCEVVYDKMPITLLKEGQEFKAKCITKVGYGLDHAKFSPGMMFYRNSCTVSLPKKYKEIISSTFPENKIKDKGDSIIVYDDKIKPVSDFCEGLCQRDKESCEVKEDSNMIITIESFGQMSAEEIFKSAIDVLKSDLSELSKAF